MCKTESSFVMFVHKGLQDEEKKKNYMCSLLGERSVLNDFYLELQKLKTNERNSRP